MVLADKTDVRHLQVMNLTLIARIAGPVVALLCATMVDIPGHPEAASMLGLRYGWQSGGYPNAYRWHSPP